jgi:hypothetical protein
MSVNWKTVKRKLNLRRRNIVDVELPGLTEVEARVDREADQQRRGRLQHEGHPVEGDRHDVRELYRGLYGQP